MMTPERIAELRQMDKWPQSRPELSEALDEIIRQRAEILGLQLAIAEMRPVYDEEQKRRDYAWNLEDGVL